MLWLFSSDLSLYVLSLLEFKDICTLYLLSRNIRQFLINHESAIFHQLAILHRFVSVGIALEDAARAEEHRGGWLDGVQTWKELCTSQSSKSDDIADDMDGSGTGHRWVTMERNWSGKGTILEGGYLTFNEDVYMFKIDEVERVILAVTNAWGTQTLVVRTIEDGRLLWSLGGVRSFLLHAFP